MPVDFSMTNYRFPMSSGGNGLLCLYEAVSGRNVGFRQGGDGGGKYDNSHSIQIYGQDRGAPLDARQGTEESSAPSPQACQSKCLSEQLGAILYILGSVSVTGEGSPSQRGFYAGPAEFSNITFRTGNSKSGRSRRRGFIFWCGEFKSASRPGSCCSSKAD